LNVKKLCKKTSRRHKENIKNRRHDLKLLVFACFLLQIMNFLIFLAVDIGQPAANGGLMVPPIFYRRLRTERPLCPEARRIYPREILPYTGFPFNER
jgi:hypothetical protein